MSRPVGGARRAAPWVALFLFALGLRALYLGQIAGLPFVETPMVDARSYSQWGQAIAAGDWLGDRVFYQAPAYPYLLGVVYWLFGHEGLAVQVVQAAMGAAACVFLAFATRRLFGANAGWAAGVILALYAPALFFDGMIQKASLGLFLTSALLALLVAFPRSPGPGRAVAIGVSCGLLALTRENALIFAAVLPLWMLARTRETVPFRMRAVHAGGVVLGCALVLFPVGVRNQLLGDTFAITTSQLGPNFYIGNNAEATGLYAPMMPGRQTPDFEGGDARRAAEWLAGRALDPGEVSDFWLSRSLDWIRSQPGAWLALSITKLLYTLNDYEIPDTEDIYVHAEFSSLLAALHSFARFGVLLPLACAGLVFAWRERGPPSAAPLVAALGAVFALAVAAFYVWARYRFPLVPLLLPFAGLGLARTLEAVREPRETLGRLAAPAAVFALAAGVANLSLFDRERMSQVAWINLGNAMLHERRSDVADGYLARALAIPHESADLHFHVAALRLQQRRTEEAETHLRQMLALDPTDWRGHRLLAEVLRRRGADEEARHHLREGIRLDPVRQRPGRAGAPIPAPEPAP